MSDYTFSVLREFSVQEISELESACRADLDSLLERYFSQYNMPEDFPLSASDFDMVRGAWLLDERDDRPEYSSVVRSIGFAFGQLLATDYGFSWALIEDPYGEIGAVACGRFWPMADPHNFPKVDARAAGFGKSRR